MTITIQEAIDTIISAVPGAPFPETVDTIKIGDPAQPLTGILLTFLATAEAIEQAVQLGANLIIAHEPTFYNHPDATAWLAGNTVYTAKRQLLERHRLVIWRFHDYLHSIPPDSTVMGLLKELGWETYTLPDQLWVCQIPPMTLRDIALKVKERLGPGILRVVGDLESTCQTVGLLPGFPGGEWQISALDQQPGLEVLITGEIHEWETSEYVRDAVRLGFKKGLIVMGHAASEEPGMKWIVSWLQECLPHVPIHFVPTGSPFQQL